MAARYTAAPPLPRMRTITARAVMLVAGPASRKTRAAPGLTPLRIRAAAIGVDAVAQMYMGMPATSMSSMALSPPPRWREIRSSGTSTVMAAATARPTKNQPARSPQMSYTA